MSDAEESGYLEIAAHNGWIKPLAQQRSRDMCERILDAAFQVFTDKGYQATGVSDITSLAGCSVGIFYKRFSDKEGLFFTLQHRFFSAAHRRYDMILEAPEADSIDKIFRGFVQRTRKSMLANTGFIKAQVELALIDPRVADARMANVRYAADRLLQILVQRGELPNTKEMRNKLEMAVRVTFATLTHLVLFGPGPYPVNDKRVIDNLTETFIGFLHEEQYRLGIAPQ